MSQTAGSVSCPSPVPAHPFTLPPELIELITKEIKDRADLAALSLSNRSWGAFSQAFLFESFEIVANLKVSSEERESATPLPGKLKLLSPFPEVLSFLDSSPHIAHYIKNLTIRSRLPLRQHLVISLDDGSEFVSLVRRVPSLQTLLLDRVTIAYPSDESLARRNLNLRLRSLALQGAVINPLHLAMLAPKSPTKFFLKLSQTPLSDTQTPLVLLASALEINSCPSLAGISFPNLTSLSLSSSWAFTTDYFFTYVSAVLASNGRELKRLSLNITTLPSHTFRGCLFRRFRIENSANFPDVDELTLLRLLPLCPSLEHFYFAFPMTIHNATLSVFPSALDVLAQILSSAPTTLTTLTLGIYLHISHFHRTNRTGDAEGTWQSLSHALDKLHNLTSVRILELRETEVGGSGFTNPGSDEHWYLRPMDANHHAFFTPRFKSWNERGFLFFS